VVHLPGVHLLGVHLLGVHVLGVHLLGVHVLGVHLPGVHLAEAWRVKAQSDSKTLTPRQITKNRPNLTLKTIECSAYQTE
jgi:hypothetical protein